MPIRTENVNRIITALPKKDQQHFLKSCRQVELNFPDVLCGPGERIREVYFPIESFIALLVHLVGGVTLEVGLVGNEGMFGIPLVLGVNISAEQALVQGSGSAWQISTAVFRREFERSTALQRALNRYAHVLMSQLAQSVACTHFHLVEARLARWLLMTQDRAHSDNFHFTHEVLAHTLGVRRVGITKAAGLLQKRKLISYNRGHITILDSVGLEAASCGCYRANKETYERTLV